MNFTGFALLAIAAPLGVGLAFALRRKAWGGMVSFILIASAMFPTDPWIGGRLAHHPLIGRVWMVLALTGVVGLFVGMKLEKIDKATKDKNAMLRDVIDRKLCEQHIVKTLSTIFTLAAADVRTRLQTMPDDELERLKESLDAIAGRTSEAP